MIKNMFKRTYLNITRKKGKSIVMIIVMFVIANLVLASLAISNAVDESTAYAKETLGSELYLNANMDDLKNQIMNGSMNQSESFDRESMMGLRPEITSDMVEDIASSEYVLDYTYSVMINAEPGNYEKYNEEESSSMFGRMNMGGSITAINSYAFIAEVENNIIEITDGAYFDESTEGKVIISYELAAINEFSIGDEITFIHSETEEEVSYEIIGIFTASEEGYEDNIYMNITSAESLMSEEMYNDGAYTVSGVTYFLNDPETSDKFIEEVNGKYDLEELNLTLDINNSAYEQMAGPIESVGSFASTILIVVIIAAVLIITLIINNNIKDRKYEMGVLMSLGATKKNIVGQIFLELIIVSTVGFILSIATSQLLASSLSESLLENQLTMSEETSENNFGRPTTGNMRNMLNGGEEVEVIDDIDVSIDISGYVMLFAIGYIISFIAMTVPTINIMRYEPKTILTGRE